MDKELYEDIIDSLANRESWERKQEGFVKVRFGGIHRTRKPYPGAPDMHYPLADSTIDKLKPLFIQQLYAQDTLAQFVATKQQDPSKSTGAAEYFDYKMKQCSNFEEEMFSGIDQFNEAGFITVKVYTRNKKLCFSSIDNMHAIVPDHTEDIQAADWFVHVIPMSPAQYKRNPNYLDKSDSFINSIKGKGSGVQGGGGETAKDQLLKLREGIAYGQKNQIIIWEVWRKKDESENAPWVVDTISPVLGHEKLVRNTFENPFKHGKLPFFRVRSEITKKGWYTPRGVPELLAPLQMGLKKLWDGSLQYVDFNCLPTYKNTGSTPLPNANNYRATPGGILPPGVDGATNPSAPIDFQVQMGTMRAVAEDRISIPDLGAPMHYSGAPDQKGNVTARQISEEVNQSNQGNDMRARVFRLDLAAGFKLAWLTLIEIDQEDVNYLLGSDLKQVDPSSLHAEYTITPNGSADSWNKPQQWAKAMTRYQAFRGDPYTNQAEIRKAVWELDGTGAVKRFFQDPGEELKDQEEQQAQEIAIILLGYIPRVSAADDDKAHLKSIDEFVQRRRAANEPFTGEVARILLAHGAEHMQALAQKKDPMLKAVEALTIPTVQFLQQISQQPDNVIPMQSPSQAGAGAPGSVVAPSGGPAGAAPNDGPDPDLERQKVEIQKGNMLATMAKAGMAINHAEVDKVLAALRLPPLATNPIPAVTSQLNEPQPQVA